MSPAVREIKGLDTAIAEDKHRLVEITNTIAFNQRKRDVLAGALSAEEKAELDPAPAVTQEA